MMNGIYRIILLALFPIMISVTPVFAESFTVNSTDNSIQHNATSFTNKLFSDKVKTVSPNTYVNSLYGFSITPPENWVIEEKLKKNGITINVHPKALRHDPSNFWIIHSPTLKTNTTEIRNALNSDNAQLYEKQIFEDALYMLGNGYTEPQLLKQELKTYDDAIKLTTEFTELDPFDVTRLLHHESVVFALNEGDMFIMRFTALEGNFQRDVIKFRNAVDTFYIYPENTIPIQSDDGGGCPIATAAFGSELAPQVQFLREVRDNTVMSTGSGIAFMSTFNQFYYSFSPHIADYERENPVFKEAVKLFITPMISSLSIMTVAEDGSDTDVLTAGISVIALNLGMYIAVPAIIVWQIRKL